MAFEQPSMHGHREDRQQRQGDQHDYQTRRSSAFFASSYMFSRKELNADLKALILTNLDWLKFGDLRLKRISKTKIVMMGKFKLIWLLELQSLSTSPKDLNVK
jgi:hypothetical protein